MKKTVVLLIIVIYSIFSVSTATVFCQTSTPHIVIGSDVWLLSEDGEERLFLLPETYYAKITSLDETYYFVTFNGAKGKVLKSAVSTLGYHTTATGTSCELGISQDYSEFNSISLKKLPALSSAGVADIPTNGAFTYVGSYPTTDGVWYFVRYGDSYGYIRSDRTTMKEINIPTFVPEVLEEETAQDTNTDAKQTEETEEDKKAKTLRIIIIVGLAVPAVLIVVLIFRPTRTAKRYEEEED